VISAAADAAGRSPDILSNDAFLFVFCILSDVQFLMFAGELLAISKIVIVLMDKRV
jgi:hypothetical protein